MTNKTTGSPPTGMASTGGRDEEAALAALLARWTVDPPSSGFVERIVAQAEDHAQIHPFALHHARRAQAGGMRRIMAQAAGIVLCVFLGVALVYPRGLGIVPDASVPREVRGTTQGTTQGTMHVALSSSGDSRPDDVGQMLDDVFDDLEEGLLL